MQENNEKQTGNAKWFRKGYQYFTHIPELPYGKCSYKTLNLALLLGYCASKFTLYGCIKKLC